MCTYTSAMITHTLETEREAERETEREKEQDIQTERGLLGLIWSRKYQLNVQQT